MPHGLGTRDTKSKTDRGIAVNVVFDPAEIGSHDTAAAPPSACGSRA